MFVLEVVGLQWLAVVTMVKKNSVKAQASNEPWLFLKHP